MNRKLLLTLLTIYLSGNVYSQYNNPNDITYNPNNKSYYITNQAGKNIVEWKSNNTYATFLSGFTKPKGLLYEQLPFGNGFLVLDSNEVDVYDATGGYIITQSISGAVELHDASFDKTAEVLYISDIRRHMIYKVTFGPPPFYTPTITNWVSSIRNPSGIVVDKKNNRLLVVTDSLSSPVYAVNLSTAAVSNIYKSGLDNLYGIELDGQGNAYLSSWGQDNVYQVNRYFSGSPKQVVVAANPGKLLYNAATDLLMVPCFNCQKIMQTKIHNFGPDKEGAACPGDSISSGKNILITNYGTYEAGNVFRLELSDKNGSFASPASIASITDTLVPWTLKGKLPKTLAGSTGYKYRWTSSKPAIIGTSELFEIYSNPAPGAYTYDTAFVCSGSTITLGTGGGDISSNAYRWNPGTQLDNDTIPNPSAQVSSISSFFLKITNRTTGCFSLDTVVVKPILNPSTAFLPHSVAMCLNDSVRIGSVSAPPFEYTWTPAANLSDTVSSNPLCNTAVSRTYSVKVKTGSCISHDSVFVRVKPLPVFSFLTDSIAYCSGDTAALGISAASGMQYHWSPGYRITDTAVSNPKTFALTDTRYSLTVTQTSTGCSYERSRQVIVHPLPVKPVILQLNGTLKVNGANGALQWYFNGNKLNGETRDTLKPAAEGIYSVSVTNVYGCTVNSDGLTVMFFNIGKPASAVHMYPNPADHFIRFELPSANQNYLLEISDMCGRKCLEKNIRPGENVDISALQNGIFTASISAPGSVYTSRIVVQKQFSE